MTDKTKNATQVKHIPKDAQVIVSIMKDMGISDYEPKVINQLLEFTYSKLYQIFYSYSIQMTSYNCSHIINVMFHHIGYVTCVLDDSKIYANHGKKKFIDLDDVRLAVKMQLEKSFTSPPPREVLLEVAKEKNNVPLPFVKPSYGLRLPPDRYCLNAANYKYKSPVTRTGRNSIGNVNAAGGGGRLNSLGYSVVKRPGTISNVSRSQTISMPKPVYKVNTGKIIYFLSNNYQNLHILIPLIFMYCF